MATLIPRAFAERLLWPLRRLAGDPAQLQRLFARIGIDAPVTAADAAKLAFVAELVELADRVATLIQALSGPTPAAGAVVETIEALDALGARITSLADGPALPAGSPLDSETVKAFAAELPGLLLADALAAQLPAAAALMRLLGVLVGEEPATQRAPKKWWRPVRRERLVLAELGPALADPVGRVRDRWSWKPGKVDGDQVVRDLVAIVRLLGFPARLAAAPESVAKDSSGAARWKRRSAALSLWSGLIDGDRQFVEAGVIVSPLAGQDSGDDGVIVTIMNDYPATGALPLFGDWTLDTTGVVGAGVRLTPAGTTLFGPGAASAFTYTLASMRTRQLDLPLLKVAIPGLSVVLAFNSSPPDVRIALGTVGARPITLELDPGAGSPFLTEILGDPITFEAAIELSWSALAGLQLGGAPGLELTIPLDRQLGPLRVLELSLGLGVDRSKEATEVAARISGSAALGPFTIVAEGVGVALQTTPGRTLLGVDVEVVPVPPTAIGLSVDVGPVAGGGFLKIDPDGGEYAGVLELELLSVAVCAIGLINTRLPDGGWSLFLALFIEVPAIQLGFGFTLNGVGGLAGVNRTIAREGLQSVIRSGSLDSVLFPKDPIRDAPRTIEAVQTIFPSAPGQYVFGPVVKLGWGTPTLVEAVLGIAITLPDLKLVVLGSVTSVLPTPEANLVGLHLESAGYIDPAAGILEISAGLHDSHIAGFPLSGGMALLLELGDAPVFLMALGGCHPRFERPAGFPALDRLALAIGAGDFIAIRFTCYFALSSNSLQFGSAFELTAEVEGFAINGSAEFDALVIFAPFSLRTSLHFDISVTAVGVDLLAVRLDVRLSGPNPWHIVGTASFNALGFETSIRLDRRIGAKRPDPPPMVEDLLGRLRADLAAPEAWSAGPGGGQGVRFAAGEPQPGELVVAPDGTLGVSQRVVPLGVTIDRGEPWQIEGGYTWFDLEAVAPGLATSGELSDWFALSAYSDPSPQEQLSAPSFDRLKSGLAFGDGGPTAGTARLGTLDHEHKLRDPELAAATVDLPAPGPSATPLLGALTPVATSRPVAVYTLAADATLVTVAPARFVPVDRLTGAATGPRQSWAASRLSPAGRKVQNVVVPSWEADHE